MRFEASRLAADLGGTLAGPAGEDPPTVDGLAIDSRNLSPGQLFAAVSGIRDGHDFVPSAREAGAPAVLVDHLVDHGWSIVVPDVPRALIRLAGLARRRLPEFVVGITGSVGKTTTKDLLAAVLGRAYRVTAAEGSFNNELGVPITLAGADPDTEAVVVEMGARGHGHISALCSMAHPTVGVVTAVQAVHTEHMGGEEQIAVAKRELVEHLPPDGLAVLHAADPRVAAMAAHTRARVLTFGGQLAGATGGTGAGGGATGDGAHGEVHATGVVLDDSLRASFTLESPWGSAPVHLGARGVHNVPNALAAAAVALWRGMAPEAVAEGLAEPLRSPWRMELAHAADGMTVLNDAYNAGPASMAAALRSLAALPAGHRVAVLGAMAELGDRSPEEHRAVSALAAELGIVVVPVGTDLYGGDPVADAEAALAALADGGYLGPDTAVLVKGSRMAGLEAVAHGLLA